MQLTLGQRIYYTGDMANQDGAGMVVAVNPPDRFAHAGTVDIALDDGREMRGLYPTMFDPSVGRRFWPLDEWLADRQRRMAESVAQMKAVIARAKGQKA